MRIPCPFCGERDSSEFTTLGEPAAPRPDSSVGAGSDPAAVLAQFVDVVHLRDNVAGQHEELWYHGAGCRSWLLVTRDTRTHVVSGARFAGGDRS